MSSLMYIGPVAIPSTFTTVPGKPSTHVYEGAIPMSSEDQAQDFPVSMYIFVATGQASPLEGVYFVSACVAPVVKFDKPEDLAPSSPLLQVKKEEDDEMALTECNPCLLLAISGVCQPFFRLCVLTLYY